MSPAQDVIEVLPVYLIHWNAAEWCRSAVDTILRSSGVEIDMTVVDNGQCGGPPLRELLPPEVRLISASSNRGFAAAANIALVDWLFGYPDSEFCVIGAHDLHLERDALAKLLRVGRSRPDAGVLAPSLVAPSESSGGRWEGRWSWQLPLVRDQDVVARDWAAGTCLLLRRTCVEQVGGFDERFGSYLEDVDYCVRVRDAGWGVNIVTKATAWGLGSKSEAAGAMIEANTVLLAAKRSGWIRGAPEGARLGVWLARSLSAAALPTRTVEERSASMAFARRHAHALRRLGASIPAFAGRPPLSTSAAASRTSFGMGSPANRSPFISVIVVTRNRLALLREAIASVIAQTFGDWELIVIDDASADGTGDWLSGSRLPRLRAVRLAEHAERCSARNRGLREARGSWVFFLDDDDRLRPRALSTLAAQALRESDAVLGIAGRHTRFEAAGPLPALNPWHRRHLLRRPWLDVLLGWVMLPSQGMIRTDALRALGGWKESLSVGGHHVPLIPCEDQELLLRVGLHGHIRLVPQKVVDIREHAGQWRPADVGAIERALRTKFVAECDTSLQQRGQRALAARDCMERGTGAFSAGNAYGALLNYSRAIRAYPKLITSPVVRPAVVRPMLKALGGSKVLLLGRRLRAQARAGRRRNLPT